MIIDCEATTCHPLLSAESSPMASLSVDPLKKTLNRRSGSGRHWSHFGERKGDECVRKKRSCDRYVYSAKGRTTPAGCSSIWRADRSSQNGASDPVKGPRDSVPPLTLYVSQLLDSFLYGTSAMHSANARLTDSREFLFLTFNAAISVRPGSFAILSLSS
jgi:hypothetical protein